MDITKMMILVEGKDQTERISEISEEVLERKVKITYINGTKSYSFNQCKIQILENPKKIDLNGKCAYINGIPIYKPKMILDFGERIRVIDCYEKSIVVTPQEFSWIENDLKSQNGKTVLAYLKDISQYTSEDKREETFLQKEMEKLTFIHPESVLSCYLNKQPVIKRTIDSSRIIFPFRFNLSQKTAVENALTNSISVIAGPPGTGKTQTILNILANLVSIQKKSVAVVSNNNEAVKNVIEKMAKKEYGFLTALLGKYKNQEAFFQNMQGADVSDWNCEENIEQLDNYINELNVKLDYLLREAQKKEQLLQQIRAWKLEQQHFEDYYQKQNVDEISKLPLFKSTPERIIAFLAETSLAKEYQKTGTFLYKIKLLFKYRILDYKKLEQQELAVLLSLQKLFYKKQIEKLEQELSQIIKKLQDNSFDEILNLHQQYSEKLFRKQLYQRYHPLVKSDFTIKNFKIKFAEFIESYPIILSTTHALRRSIPENYLLDYVIIDEASQVDLITGVLALSCCRNVIIVGDEKQLPQIVDEKIQQQLKVKLPEQQYNYFENSILASVTKIYNNNLPNVMLREHYRCHPQIIEFCNQKYYDGQLIAYTNEKMAEHPLVIHRASQGNHMRDVTNGENTGKYNQRELDIIKQLLEDMSFQSEEETIGVVTPYRKQANKARNQLRGVIESDTIHKYQGREKDTMIMTTVLDNSWKGKTGLEFVDQPQMVNVAVSRAIKKFILVTDHKLFFEKGRNINDLIRYMQYSTLDKNLIESQIVSVFDLLYHEYSGKLSDLKQGMRKNARYQSEEALRVLLEEVLAETAYQQYTYRQGVLLRNLLSSAALLTEEEERFVNNRASLDFVVYYKLDKSCALVIEVDGFAFHENNPEQLRRDKLKTAILEKYGVKLLRLPTNGSEERSKIKHMLDN